MKFWTEESVLSDNEAPEDVSRIATDVLATFDRMAVAGFSWLLSIGKHDDEEEDSCRYAKVISFGSRMG